MKPIVNVLIAILLAASLLACENEEIKAILNESAKSDLSFSAASLTLLKEKADENAVTLSWTKPDYGYSAAVQYKVWVDKANNDFKSAQSFTTGTNNSLTWTHKQLNTLLQSMGFKPNETASLDVVVETIFSEALTKRTDTQKLTAVLYLDKLDLSSTWGLVGSATPNGWEGPDVPFYKTSTAGVFVCYAKLADGDIKIRENNAWDLNYGDNGANGSLEVNGANIVVKAGSYKITFDAVKLTVKVENFSWGLVGSATPNGWNGPDIDFFYDPATDQFRALATLGDGDLKIRKNNDWSINYGDNGADGTLELNGANIKVAKGVYLITFNERELTVTVERTAIPGIVGSAAPNGWNGPDVSMIPDFSKDGLWVARNIKLAAGDIKFRMNNDWSVNYGDDGGDKILDLNGANITVTAGTYDIELHLGDPAKLTYSITKK
jgi:hypothetical protein